MLFPGGTSLCWGGPFSTLPCLGAFFDPGLDVLAMALGPLPELLIWLLSPLSGLLIDHSPPVAGILSGELVPVTSSTSSSDSSPSSFSILTKKFSAAR